jgi:hypothetical protein
MFPLTVELPVVRLNSGKAIHLATHGYLFVLIYYSFRNVLIRGINQVLVGGKVPGRREKERPERVARGKIY